MKKVLIILGAVLVLAVALLWVGSKYVFYKDSEGFHLADKNAAQIFTDTDARKFTDIEIKTDSTNIEFITALHYGYEYMANSTVDTVYSNENGKLTITQSSKSLLFNFNLSGKSDYIKVYIPERAEMKNVKITNVSGNVTIAKLTAYTLDIFATSGNIDTGNIQSTGVYIDNTSGNININTCKTNSLKVLSTSGQIVAKNLETGGLQIKQTSGNTELDGKLLGGNDITSISGNVTLNIIGEKKDYNSNISVVSGNVSVDGSNTKTYEYENAEAANSLKINSTSGNVTVNFRAP